MSVGSPNHAGSLHAGVKKTFNKNGMSIPFPQLDVPDPSVG